MKQLLRITQQFAVLAILAGCAVNPPPLPQTLVVTKNNYISWDWPVYLQTCQGDPVKTPEPHIAATDPHAGSKVAHYVVAIRGNRDAFQAAGDDCRAVLSAAVQAWQLSNSKPTP